MPTPMWWSKMCPDLRLTESEPRGMLRTAFVENLGGAWHLRRHQPPLLGGFKWLPWGPPFAMCLTKWWEA